MSVSTRTAPQAEAQEKAIVRVELIAAGIIRYHKHGLLSPLEKQQALEILADELVGIEGSDEALTIRTNVEKAGLQIPIAREPVHVDSPVGLSPAAETSDSEVSQLCTSKEVPYSYVRHSNNQVSEEIEMHIQELLGRGWNKSAIARSLRLNRRVVIRVARSSRTPSGKVHNSAAVGCQTF